MLIHEGMFLKQDRVMFVFPLHSIYETKILKQNPKDYQTIDMDIFYK